MTHTDSKPALKIDSVVKDYGKSGTNVLRALNSVSFEVAPGEVFGLLGPNGAGKTSLISIIVTLEKATSGKAEVFGHDVTMRSRESKLRTGWVPQEIINHGYFSVDEILNYYGGYFGVRDTKPRIDELLHALGLVEHRHKKVKQLSGGMKRRLMIAKALVHKPGLLLLDEPTAGVDVDLRTRLWDFVEAQRKLGTSVLLTTHYLEEAERLCDRVAIIHKGEIRAIGKTRSLIEQWSRKKVTVKLSGATPGFTHPDLVEGSGKDWTFLTKMNKPLGELLQELQIHMDSLEDVQVNEGNLEDVFKILTKEEAQHA